MVKGRKEEFQTNGRGTFRFRYMDTNRQFEVEANNVGGESLLEGFRHVANAISGRNVAHHAPQLLNATGASVTATAKAAGPRDNQENFEFEPQAASAPTIAEEDAETSERQETPTNGNEALPKRNYSYKTPTFQNDLDITKAKKDLKQFMAEKNPPNVTMKYLATVYWLQKHMDIPEVTIDQVYTIFDILGWKAEMPSNPSVPLRDLKSKSHMLTREPGAEGYKLNFKGEQEVEKMK